MTVKVIELLPGSVVVFPNQPTKEVTALMKERSETKPWTTLFLSGTAVTVLQPSPETAAELRTKQKHAQHLVERSAPIGVITADVCLEYVSALSIGDAAQISKALENLKFQVSLYEAAKFPKPKLTDFQDPITSEIDYAVADIAFNQWRAQNGQDPLPRRDYQAEVEADAATFDRPIVTKTISIDGVTVTTHFDASDKQGG